MQLGRNTSFCSPSFREVVLEVVQDNSIIDGGVTCKDETGPGVISINFVIKLVVVSKVSGSFDRRKDRVDVGIELTDEFVCHQC